MSASEVFRSLRASRAGSTLSPTNAPPPRRMLATSQGLPGGAVTPLAFGNLSASMAESSATTAPPSSNSSSNSYAEEDDDEQPIPEPDPNFNGVFYALKAFSLASAFVLGTAGIGIYGVKSYWDIKDVCTLINPTYPLTSSLSDFYSLQPQDYAARMRSFVSLTFPKLSQTINEALSLEPFASKIEDTPDWKWEEVEERLGKAYEERGIVAWAVTALEETEEGRAEKLKREKEKQVTVLTS